MLQTPMMVEGSATVQSFFFESLHHPFFFNPAPALLWLLWRLNSNSQVKVQKNINSKCLREWISKIMLRGLYASCKGCLHGLSITISSIENKLRDLPIWRSIRSWSKNQEKSNQKEIKDFQTSWQSLNPATDSLYGIWTLKPLTIIHNKPAQ